MWGGVTLINVIILWIWVNISLGPFLLVKEMVVVELWLQIILNIVIGLVTGVLSSCFTNYVIGKRVVKRLKNREIVLSVYTTLLKFEDKKIGDVGINEINDFLIESSVNLERISSVSKTFEVVRGDIVAALRLGNEDNSIVNKNGEEIILI